MKFKVYWKDIKFLEVEKIKDVYYSNLVTENIQKVKEEGYPMTFISNVKVMNHELPKLIQSRLPSIQYISSQIESNENIENAIVEYINRTKCKRVTDFLTLEIEE